MSKDALKAFPYMITVEEAFEILQQKGKEVFKDINTEIIPTEQAIGRVLARDILARENLPSFTNSAMDGFAVNSKDLEHASETNVVCLEKIDESVAGIDPNLLVPGQPGKTTQIMTGAPLPSGYDAVVKVEDVRIEGQNIFFSIPTTRHENIRFSGEDVSSGDLIIEKHALVTTDMLLTLCAQGISEVTCYEKLKVGVCSTGDEIVDYRTPNLKPGQIRNSTRPYLIAELSRRSCQVTDLGTVNDDPKSIDRFIDKSFNTNYDLIITTGGVSAGKYDLIPNMVEKHNGEIFFHKIQIKPGKPVLFAKINSTFIIGLPGNPVSTMVGTDFFIKTFIRAAYSRPQPQAKFLNLKNDVRTRETLHTFLKAEISENNMGINKIKTLSGQESFKVKPLQDTDIWALSPKGQSFQQAESTIGYFPKNMEL